MGLTIEYTGQNSTHRQTASWRVILAQGQLLVNALPSPHYS